MVAAGLQLVMQVLQARPGTPLTAGVVTFACIVGVLVQMSWVLQPSLVG